MDGSRCGKHSHKWNLWSSHRSLFLAQCSRPFCTDVQFSRIFCNILQYCTALCFGKYRMISWNIARNVDTGMPYFTKSQNIAVKKMAVSTRHPPLIESVTLQSLSNTASLSNWHFTKKTKPRQTIDIQLHLLSNPKDLERILKSIDIYYWFSNRQAKSRQVLPILHIVLGSKHFHCLLNHIQSLHFLDGTNPLYDIFYLNLCYASWIVLKIKNIVFKWSINMVS